MIINPLRQLSDALSLCQGCHEKYRIEVNNNRTMGQHKMQSQQGNGLGKMKQKGDK